MIEELVELKLTYNLGHHSGQEIRDHLLDVIHRNTYFITLSADRSRITGYLEYDMTHDRLLQVRDLICTAPGVIWQLRKQLRTLDYTRIFFKRWKTSTWTHRRRSAHATF